MRWGLTTFKRGIIYLIVIFLLIIVSPLYYWVDNANAEDPPNIRPDMRWGKFKNPEPITISGYNGDAMEPFITRDGRYLFFNNLNDPSVNTNLHYAKRLDAVTFKYLGEIKGVNTKSLEGVPTMDLNSNFFFVSTNSYKENLSTIYCGRFDNGSVSDVEVVSGISLKKPGFLNFDVEISPDGETLYYVIGRFGLFGHVPKSSDIAVAYRHTDISTGNGFKPFGNSNETMKNSNTEALEYAVAISADGLEIFFTRLNMGSIFSTPKIGIFTASRGKKSEHFGVPKRIESIKGFVEAPTLSPDERSLYYHKKIGDRFVIYLVVRYTNKLDNDNK